jgi:hypothetical protein
VPARKTELYWPCYHACTSETSTDVPAIKLQFLVKTHFNENQNAPQKGFCPIENCNVLKSCENDSTIHKGLFLLTRMALFFVEDKKQRTFYELSLLLSYFALMYL